MSLQILEIVIYSHDGRQRKLLLNHGAVSVITGASKTGKSALIDIVDYCFGSGKCHVAEGPIRRCVSWFGLRLRVNDGQAFVARRCPSPRAESSQDCYVEIGEQIEAPPFERLQQTTNADGLTRLLADWCGIQDNVHEPPTGQRRPPLIASIRHALDFCLQSQDEINRKNQLFHGTDNHWEALALSDAFPYFLGAVADDYVRKREQLRRLKEELRQCERQLGEMKSIQGQGASKASALLAQARDVGLTFAEGDTWEAAIAALQELANIQISPEEAPPENAEFRKLADERGRLLDGLRRATDELAAVKSYQQDEQGFSREAQEQQARLRTIGIFDGIDPTADCPFCKQALPQDEASPVASEISGTLRSIAGRLDAVSRTEPHIQRVLSGLEANVQEAKNALARNRIQMEAVRSSDERLSAVQDARAKQAHVLGRISLYIESIPSRPDTSALEARIDELLAQKEALEEELSDQAVLDRLNSIVYILGQWMTEWARTLELEYAGHLLRLDVKKLTIVADTIEDGAVPLSRMGSAENWVGYHLIAHLALHKWFSQRNRPVPRFLFLDQPSQVYFPEEVISPDGSPDAASEDDRMLVSRMLRKVFEIVGEESPGFQVIITEHANLAEEWYQEAIVERWRGGRKLVPEDWPRAEA